MNKNVNISTKEAQDLLVILNSVDYIFKRLKAESGKNCSIEDEKTWKDLFSKQIILHADTFLKELAEDINIEYKTDSRIDDLRDYIEKMENS